MLKKYYQLTKKEKQDLIDKWILNWFWPQIKKEYSIFYKIWLYILRYCLKILSVNFNIADSYYHDYWYYIWWDEKRRLECDLKFHYFICRDIHNWNYNIFKRVWLYILSSIFFLAVRMGWKMSFNYKK